MIDRRTPGCGIQLTALQLHARHSIDLLPDVLFGVCCSQKLDGPYDNRVLPVVLTVVLMTFLTIVWIGSIVRCAS